MASSADCAAFASVGVAWYFETDELARLTADDADDTALVTYGFATFVFVGLGVVIVGCVVVGPPPPPVEVGAPEQVDGPPSRAQIM